MLGKCNSAAATTQPACHVVVLSSALGDAPRCLLRLCAFRHRPLHRACGHVREQKTKTLCHRRVRKHGVAKFGIRQPRHHRRLRAYSFLAINDGALTSWTGRVLARALMYQRRRDTTSALPREVCRNLLRRMWWEPVALLATPAVMSQIKVF